jgi:excisionase family DNA binding protein
MDMDNEVYMSIKEFTEFLGITKPTVYKWMRMGLPYFQVDGKGVIKIQKYKALRWLEESTPSNIKK